MTARTFSLGGFGRPTLNEQGLNDVLSAAQIKHFERDDEAISRLYRRGIISSSARLKAREKLAAKIRAAVRRAHDEGV